MTISTNGMTETLSLLFSELVHGAPRYGFILNGGDVGLLASLDRIDAQAASALTVTGSSIAAHVDHVRYGLSLMNRWAAGENPFEDADWAASWQRTTVSADEWTQLKVRLREEAERWLAVLRSARDVNATELNGMVGSIVHLGYHLGAIRQIDHTMRGPNEGAASG